MPHDDTDSGAAGDGGAGALGPSVILGFCDRRERKNDVRSSTFS